MTQPLDFRALYEAHFEFVWRCLRRHGLPEDDLPDAVQEVFIVVLRKLPTFEPRAKLTTWLYAICARVASDRRRALRTRRETAASEVSSHPNDAEKATLPLDEIERRSVLHEILAQMPEGQRIVFTLFELEGMTALQIADELSLPMGTVYSRLRLAREVFHRACKRFRARNGAYPTGEDGEQ
jgi:RNA polymerase sigma-70 factor (ECF subfamily)